MQSPSKRPKFRGGGAGLYALDAESLDGARVDLSRFNGTVSLIVNVASECGFTPQYASLQKLHDELGSRGFQVLGFPSNNFGAQEPGTAAQIRAFCTDRYAITFPMFAKVVTRGSNQSPIYSWLEKMTGEVPSWNFFKYLVDREGDIVGVWRSRTLPEDDLLRVAIEAALTAGA